MTPVPTQKRSTARARHARSKNAFFRFLVLRRRAPSNLRHRQDCLCYSKLVLCSRFFPSRGHGPANPCGIFDMPCPNALQPSARHPPSRRLLALHCNTSAAGKKTNARAWSFTMDGLITPSSIAGHGMPCPYCQENAVTAERTSVRVVRFYVGTGRNACAT
jgi:hypothetical protein